MSTNKSKSPQSKVIFINGYPVPMKKACATHPYVYERKSSLPKFSFSSTIEVADVIYPDQDKVALSITTDDTTVKINKYSEVVE